jgi:hypothetical protein
MGRYNNLDITLAGNMGRYNKNNPKITTWILNPPADPFEISPLLKLVSNLLAW